MKNVYNYVEYFAIYSGNLNWLIINKLEYIDFSLPKSFMFIIYIRIKKDYAQLIKYTINPTWSVCILESQLYDYNMDSQKFYR